MKYLLLITGTIANLVLCALCSAATPARFASVVAIWRVSAPQANDAGVQAVESGAVAIGALAPQFSALAGHPNAKITFALDPVFLTGLEKAATGQSALPALAAGQIGVNDPRALELLSVLSSEVVPSSSVAASLAGKRFSAHAAAARLALRGDTNANFSQRDVVDFAGIALLLALTSSGYAHEHAALLKQDVLTNHDLQSIAAAFARACRDVLGKIKQASTRRAIELAALPAYEPIVPLLIDAGARPRQAPFTVAVGAAADAAYAVDEGARTVRALNPQAGEPGIISPHGAYDDETASLLQAHHAAYAVFSERIVKANAGASQQAVADVQSAGYRAYLLETSKTSKLPILFCSDGASDALDALAASAPASAMGDRLAKAITGALAAAPANGSAVVVLCLNANGLVLRRPDRAQVIDHFAAVLAGGGAIVATTPKEYLRQHPPTAETYGYAPGSDAGGFDLWMGSANQANLWTALADARKAAGGDAALEKTPVRDALLRAESARWYLALALPQPRYVTDQSLTQFRALIAAIYRAADLPVPATIAPVKLDVPAPVGTPAS